MDAQRRRSSVWTWSDKLSFKLLPLIQRKMPDMSNWSMHPLKNTQRRVTAITCHVKRDLTKSFTFICSTLQQGSAFLQFHKAVNSHKIIIHAWDLSLPRLPGGACKCKRRGVRASKQNEIRICSSFLLKNLNLAVMRHADPDSALFIKRPLLFLFVLLHGGGNKSDAIWTLRGETESICIEVTPCQRLFYPVTGSLEVKFTNMILIIPPEYVWESLPF